MPVLTFPLPLGSEVCFVATFPPESPPRLRTLDMDVLLARPAATVAACAQWLELPAALEGLPARVEAEFSHHAKATDVAFNPQLRLAEKQRVLDRNGELIRAALDWARREVEPRVRLPRMQPLAV